MSPSPVAGSASSPSRGNSPPVRAAAAAAAASGRACPCPREGEERTRPPSFRARPPTRPGRTRLAERRRAPGRGRRGRPARARAGGRRAGGGSVPAARMVGGVRSGASSNSSQVMLARVRGGRPHARVCERTEDGPRQLLLLGRVGAQWARKAQSERRAIFGRERLEYNGDELGEGEGRRDGCGHRTESRDRLEEEEEEAEGDDLVQGELGLPRAPRGGLRARRLRSPPRPLHQQPHTALFFKPRWLVAQQPGHRQVRNLLHILPCLALGLLTRPHSQPDLTLARSLAPPPSPLSPRKTSSGPAYEGCSAQRRPTCPSHACLNVRTHPPLSFRACTSRASWEGERRPPARLPLSSLRQASR